MEREGHCDTERHFGASGDHGRTRESSGQALALDEGRCVDPEFERACEAMAWRYAPGKGRAGGRFERVVPSEALAA